VHAAKSILEAERLPSIESIGADGMTGSDELQSHMIEIQLDSFRFHWIYTSENVLQVNEKHDPVGARFREQ
jgi:hypothetical protein